MKPALFVLLFALAAWTGSGAASTRVDVKIDPAVTQTPGRVRIMVRHTPAEHDRALRVETDGPEFFHSTWQPLEGADAASLHIVALKDLPKGDYLVRAVIEREGSTDETGNGTFKVTTTTPEPADVLQQ